MRNLLGLFMAIFFVVCSCTGGNQKLYLILDYANGLKVGSSVMSRGVVIGRVRDINLQNSNVVIAIQIKKEYRLPKESKFELAIDNALDGVMCIDVTFSNSKDFYSNADSIIVHNNKQFENERKPIELDSSSKAEMLKVFKQLDTLLNTKKK